MQVFKWGFCGLVLAAELIASGFQPVSAEEIVCRRTLGRITVDNVVVPDNARCVLNRTRVQGTVKVENNAVLTTRRAVIIGNVQAENHRQVEVLKRTRVGGSVQVKQGGGATVSDSTIDGDVQYDSNNRMLRVLRSDVGGSVQVVQNDGRSVIRRNVIDGNLQCKENVPAPTGGGNVVGGNKEDQCRRL